MRHLRLILHAYDGLVGRGLYFPLFYAGATIPPIVDMLSVTDILVVSFCSLLFGMSVRESMPMMTSEGLYFPLFYAEMAIPHIVEVISVSDILVVVAFCFLWDERLRIHANDDWSVSVFSFIL